MWLLAPGPQAGHDLALDELTRRATGAAGAAMGIAKFLFWAGIIIAVVLFLIGMSVAKKVS